MADSFCDRTPCKRMRVALSLLRVKGGTNGQVNLLVLKGDNKVYPPSTPPILLALDYCPFCGTRIESDWLESVLDRGRA